MPHGGHVFRRIQFVLAIFLEGFPIGILGQVWYLFVSIPDLCTLTYFVCLILSEIFVATTSFSYFCRWSTNKHSRESLAKIGQMV